MHPTPVRRFPHILMILLVLLAGCASAPPDPAPTVGHGDATRAVVVREAARQIGTPYRYGGNRPGGFDCSGLVHFTHGQAGLAVPRTTIAQWRAAAPVQREQLLPGDLLFFAIGTEKSRHVAIYEGDGRFIHAPSAGKPVSRASLDNPYWKARWIGSRTFI